MERVATWFECEDGYPTEESIERLSNANLSWEEADRFLLLDLPEIKKGIGCMSVDIEDADRHGRPVKRVTYVTGGWSGAEDLIAAMLDNATIKLMHTKWLRGGLFEFEVPVKEPPHDPS